MPECTIVEKQTKYNLAETGLWGDAIRKRRPIITNDYAESHVRQLILLMDSVWKIIETKFKTQSKT